MRPTPYSVVLKGGVRRTRTTPSADDATLEALYQQFSEPEELDTSADEYAALSKKQRSDLKKDLAYFVGATLHGPRHDSSVVQRTMLTLDIELALKQAGDPPPPAQQVTKRLRELGGCGWVYTSISHTPDAPRYRVVLPLGNPLEVDDVPTATEALKASTLEAARKLGVEQWCTPESWVLSQPMYAPVRLRGGEFFQAFVKGKAWRTVAPAAPAPREKGQPADIPDDAADPVLHAIKAAGLYLREGKAPGMHYITCPFQDQHGAENDSQTVYYEAHFNGYPHPSVKCMDTAPDEDGQPHLTVKTLVHWLRAEGHLSDKGQRDAGVLEDYTVFDARTDIGHLLQSDPPEREWAIEQFAPVGKVTVVAGPGGVSKSMLLLHVLAYAAMHHEWAGFRSKKALRSLYVSYEDDITEIHSRTHRLAESLRATDNGLLDALHDVDGTIRKNLRLFAADDDAHGWLLLTKPDRFGPPERTPRVDWLVGYLREFNIKLLALDPAVYTHQLEENNIADMAAYMQTLTYIAKQAECAVVVLHHMNKVGGWAQLDDINQSSLRGASSFADNARSVAVVVSMPVKDAETYGLPAEPATCAKYAVFKHVKHNYSAPLPTMIFERQGAALVPRPEIKRLDPGAIAEARDAQKDTLALLKAATLAPKVLQCLTEHTGPISQAQIAAYLNAKHGKAKAAIDWCVGQDLVELEPAERQGGSSRHSITSEGKAWLRAHARGERQ